MTTRLDDWAIQEAWAYMRWRDEEAAKDAALAEEKKRASEARTVAELEAIHGEGPSVVPQPSRPEVEDHTANVVAALREGRRSITRVTRADVATTPLDGTKLVGGDITDLVVSAIRDEQRRVGIQVPHRGMHGSPEAPTPPAVGREDLSDITDRVVAALRKGMPKRGIARTTHAE